jgi:hypothetical protein
MDCIGRRGDSIKGIMPTLGYSKSQPYNVNASIPPGTHTKKKYFGTDIECCESRLEEAGEFFFLRLSSGSNLQTTRREKIVPV